MTSTEIDLPVPAGTNLKGLADSTLSVFELLHPWCKAEYSSLALRSIKTQAQSYINALDYSILAAQHGFNIAEEVLTFVDLINQDTEADRQEYLRGMLAIARRGEENAKQAHDSFRDVRVTLGKLIKTAKEQQSQGCSHTIVAAASLNDLEDGISVLEKFSASISLYISWWNAMNMSQTSQTIRLGQVVNYNSLRVRAVVQKWRELRQDYVDYTNKIRAIQDANPEFAVELIRARIEDDPRPPNVTEGSDEHSSSPNNQNKKVAQPAVLEPAVLLFMPISLLKHHPQDRKPHRRRDYF